LSSVKLCPIAIVIVAACCACSGARFAPTARPGAALGPRIALGVALGYGVYLVNGAAVDELAAAVRGLAGEADLEVRGGRGGFSESLYPVIARLPGVASVSPGLELDAGLAGTERSIRVIGIDALRERRPELLAPDKVLLSAAAAELVKAIGCGWQSAQDGRAAGRRGAGHQRRRSADRHRHRAVAARAPRTA